MNRITTGFDMDALQNRDLVLVATSPAFLDHTRVPYFLIDGNFFGTACLFGLRAVDVPVDEQVLRSGAFAGRGAVFDAGILIPKRLPPCGFGALICATNQTRDRVAAEVESIGVDIPVYHNSGAFMWSPNQSRTS